LNSAPPASSKYTPHHPHQRQQSVSAPEPLVDPALDDRHIVFVLLKQELDHFKAQSHVPGFVGLCRKTEGHGGHVAVERRAGHEGHEQQVGQHVLEGKGDRREEFERTRRARVFKKRLGHREEPHPVVHMGEIMQAVEVLVVVTHGVYLGLHVAQFIDGLHLAGDACPGTTELPADPREPLIGLVLQRRDARQEQLQRIDITGVRQCGMAVVL
jgi:hypothetical protein